MGGLSGASETEVRSGREYRGEYTLVVGCRGGTAGGLSKCFDIIFEGDDSAGADSGRLRGGTGGGTGASSVLLYTMEETDEDPGETRAP